MLTNIFACIKKINALELTIPLKMDLIGEFILGSHFPYINFVVELANIHKLIFFSNWCYKPIIAWCIIFSKMAYSHNRNIFFWKQNQIWHSFRALVIEKSLLTLWKGIYRDEQTNKDSVYGTFLSYSES